MSENIFSQSDVETILESHRRDLNQTIDRQRVEIIRLRAEIDKLSTPKTDVQRLFDQVEVDGILANHRRKMRTQIDAQAVEIIRLSQLLKDTE